ncbi:hypothetical protein BDW59DRAFT_41152 [Aspergillus cavernicola]|uniref:Glycosyltransferase family 31 protein n=1 Tax=Aspergillus cavernicola TaxID=176166 RepID=A0ABR4IMN4_9EURO
MQQFRLLFYHALQKHKLGPWRLLALAASFILGCLILFTYSYTGSAGVHRTPSSAELSNGKSESNPKSDTEPDSSTNACFIDLNLLRLHADNSSTVDYARLTIGVTKTENFTAFSHSLDVSIPKHRTVRLDTGASRETRSEDDCTTSVTVQAPIAPPRPDASHMVFGVATSLEKLEESLDAFSHWAGNTKTRIIAVVEQGGSSTRARVQQRAEELGILLTITQTEDDRLDRYFSLIQVLFQYCDASTQWAVLIDDDTFFPSMRNLVDRLASYDATVPQYIGGMTEDLARLSGSGYMAYGGAGIFLSIPLLEDLQYVFETCHSFKDKGDRMLASCIYAHTTAKFTWERGLYQLDLHGDASGFFESGRPLPLSIHHWKSWFQADMVALGKVADICGEECLLRRFHLSKDWFLVNGYSVIQDATLWNDPRPMEHTWDKSKYKGSDPFAYSLGPLRRVDPDKVSFRLRDVVEETDQVRQVYVFNATDAKPPQVLEVVWTVVQE